MESQSVLVKHSRLESFLKRNLISRITSDHTRGVPEEFVIHYEGVIVWYTNSSKGSGVVPFYACIIVTNYQLLLTELPPKRLKPLITLKQLTNIESVAEIPPNFLFEPYRKRAQRIRIFYYEDDDDDGSKSKKKVNLKKIDLMESSKTNSNFSWTSGSSSSVMESPRSSDENFSDFEPNEMAIDLFLLSPLSNLHHILQVTWNKYLTMSYRSLNPPNNSSDKYVIKNKDVSGVNCDDSSDKYQWLLKRISSSSNSVEKDISKPLSKLKHWSRDCHHFSKLIWKDSTILNWLLLKLKQFDDGSKESSQPESWIRLISKLLKAVATVLHCITQDAIWMILDPLYVDILMMIISVLRRYTGSNEMLLDDCCHILFALFLMQCSTFVTRVVKVLFNSEWMIIVSCISMRILTIVKQSFIKTEICKVLFKHLYILKSLIRLDDSNDVVEFLEKNHSDEFWYFASDTQIKTKVFEDVLLRKIIISMFEGIRDNIFVQFNARNKKANEYMC